MAKWEDYLAKIYFDAERAGAFAGPYKLHRIVKKEGKHKIGIKKIKHWLQDQDSYSLNRFAKEKKGGVRPYIASGLNTHFQSDLADVSNISQYNNNVRFLLIVIDTFSRYLWIAPLSDKRHVSVINGFKQLFPDGLVCKVLTTDNGREYVNQWFKKYLKDSGVYHHRTNTTRKAGIAERSISTIKILMYRYFTYKRTYHYLDVIQQLVNNYNSTPHRSLNFKSPESISKDNESSVWKKMYIEPYKLKQRKAVKLKYKFKIGNMVRVSLIRGKFARSYNEKWSREINFIKIRFHQAGVPSYRLTDYHKEDIEGIFYESELQLVHKNKTDLWTVDKVLKHRKYRGKKQSFVSFEGWRDKFSEWIDDSDITTIA